MRLTQCCYLKLIFILAVLSTSFSAHAFSTNPVDMLLGPPTALTGQSLVIELNGENVRTGDWVGIFKPANDQLLFWKGFNGPIDNEVDLKREIKLPGLYEIRYFTAGKYLPSATAEITLIDGPIAQIRVRSNSMYIGQPINVELVNPPNNASAWVGLYLPNEPDATNYISRKYLNTAQNGHVQFQSDYLKPGKYDIRLFLDNALQIIDQTDAILHSQALGQIALTARSFEVGSEIMPSFVKSDVTTTDWFGRYYSNETAQTNYLDWRYVDVLGNVQSPFRLESIGEFELRYFSRNSFILENTYSFSVVPTNVKSTTVAIVGDVSWIEPLVFEPIQTQAWPVSLNYGVLIKSSKEIISAKDLVTGDDVSVYFDGVDGHWIVEVPPFTYSSFISFDYIAPEPTKPEPNDDLRRTILKQGVLNGYTALSPQYYYNRWKWGDGFWFAEQAMRTLGLNKITRMVKAHTNRFSSLWPSDAVESLMGERIHASVEDSVTTMGQQADHHGLNFIAYYKDLGDVDIAEKFPEWVCKNPDGSPIHGQFTYLDFNSGWRDVVLQQMFELAERGVTATYLDSIHTPGWGCFGSSTENEFISRTSLEPPMATANAHWSNHPNWIRYMDVQHELTSQTIDYWSSEIKKVYPDFSLIVGTAYLSGLTSFVSGHKIASVSDVIKTEFDHGRAKGLRHKVFEKDQLDDANLAVPSTSTLMVLAHIVPAQMSKTELFNSWAYGFTDQDQLRGFIHTVLAMGGIPDVFVPEQYLASDFNEMHYTPVYQTQTPYDALKAEIKSASSITVALEDKKPVRFAGVYFDEDARTSYGLDYERAWRETIWPSVGAMEQFILAGFPVTALNRENILAKSQNLKLIYIPTAISELPLDIQIALYFFEQQGGSIIGRDQTIHWDIPEENAQASVEFRAKILPYRDKSPFWVDSSASQKLHSFFYSN